MLRVAHHTRNIPRKGYTGPGPGLHPTSLDAHCSLAWTPIIEGWDGEDTVRARQLPRAGGRDEQIFGTSNRKKPIGSGMLELNRGVFIIKDRIIMKVSGIVPISLICSETLYNVLLSSNRPGRPIDGSCSSSICDFLYVSGYLFGI